MTNRRRKMLACVCAASSWLPAAHGQVTPQACSPADYVVGFFNGIWNTKPQADEAMRRLRELNGESFKGNRLGYELFYNQTGMGRPGAAALEDLAETFVQRAQELDGLLAGRWEIFWQILAGATDDGGSARFASQRIAQAGVELKRLVEALHADIVARSAANWARLLADPPTSADYALHHTRIKALLVERKKLLLVAHSQGNLFLNKAYDAALSLAGADNVRALHVAPASPTLRGRHVLADLDLVINALRAQGTFDIAPVTALLPADHLLTDDPSGHTLADTYLRTDRQTGQQVVEALQSELALLGATDASLHAGLFTATLTWDGPGDVDLHVLEPSGAHVFHRRRQGDSGYLDVDNRSADGPEHYYVACDTRRIQAGRYAIGINHYADADGRLATLQFASPASGEMLTRTFAVGAPRGRQGEDAPVWIAEIEVSRDDRGAYQASIPH